MVSIPETGIKNETEMLNLFPNDMMEYGLGTEIKIEITDLPSKSLKETRDALAEVVGKTVQDAFPDAFVRCKVRESDPRDGSWSSPQNNSKPECPTCCSIEHMQAIDGKCPGCGRLLSAVGKKE